MHEVLGIVRTENFGIQAPEGRHMEVLKFSVKTQLIYEPADNEPMQLSTALRSFSCSEVPKSSSSRSSEIKKTSIDAEIQLKLKNWGQESWSSCY